MEAGETMVCDMNTDEVIPCWILSDLSAIVWEQYESCNLFLTSLTFLEEVAFLVKLHVGIVTH